ncbi:MAG: M24 family metallopeptidase [Candidatus Dormibacteraeota bacterium]|nr:M24 family metallopeptidase [Candidatus Dormibacteraeota bacterium]
MTAHSERVNQPIPTSELERRWTAIRAAMEREGVDVVVAQANNDFMGGYVKYLTDLPATNGYVTTVVFPRDEPMTVIGQGATGMKQEFGPDGDGIRRGVARFLGTPSYASAHYSAGYDAALAASVMGRFAQGTVGMLGTAAISFALIDGLRRGALQRARFVDASPLVDPIKAVKSAVEVELIRQTAAAQDEAMQAALDAVRPGMRELEVAAVAEHVGHSLGSEQGLFLAYSGPAGRPGQIVNRHLQHRVLEKGDQFSLLIENNGPGGFYCELGRSVVLGRATHEMKAQQQFVVEAQQFCVDLLRPGADCAPIWGAYNAFMRDHGRMEEKRVHFHGQGYDMVERPLVRHDETMPVEANMNFALHPAFSSEHGYSWASDNYLVTDEGTVERLHRFPQELLEVG